MDRQNANGLAVIVGETRLHFVRFVAPAIDLGDELPQRASALLIVGERNRSQMLEVSQRAAVIGGEVVDAFDGTGLDEQVDRAADRKMLRLFAISLERCREGFPGLVAGDDSFGDLLIGQCKVRVRAAETSAPRSNGCAIARSTASRSTGARRSRNARVGGST